MYHRVAEASSDPWGLHVSPAHFAEHVEVLRRDARPARLEALQQDLVDGATVPGSVAVTFDDGYADNLLAAAPLLARFDVPATVFVTTGYTGRGVEFWWDALDRIFLQPGDLPAVLDVTAVHLDLGAAAHYPAEDAEQHRNWRAYATEPPTARHAAFLAVWEQLVGMRDAEQWQMLAALAGWAGLPDLAARRTHRPLAHDEVIALAGCGPIDIGAHTVTHPALPALAPSEQEAEIRGSRSALERLLDRPVTGFSYPHGRHAPDTVRLIRDAGFRYACTAAPGRDVVDPLLLPRIQVPDCDGDVFLELLRGADA